MVIKRFIAAAVVCVLASSSASAAPTASLRGVQVGANYNWTLSFTPDTTYFTNIAGDNPDQGIGGSMATAYQIQLPVGALVQDSWVKTAAFNEVIGGTPIVNPGLNPYAGGASTFDVIDYTNVASDTTKGFAAGMVDAIFVPLGSTFFTSGGAKAALTFQTTSPFVRFGGLVSQNNNNGNVNDDVYTIMAASGAPLGDTDGDLDVDTQDLLNVKNNFLGTSPPSLGDTDGDSDIDTQDLLNVKNNFLKNFNPPGALANSTTIPEPASVIVLASSLVAGIFAARRRSC